jgi:DNA-directed RNA polymerase specialized sigma24 family protein
LPAESLLANNGRIFHDQDEALKTAGGREDAPAPLENRVLRARAKGELSADAAFEALFREYTRIVASWLAVRVDRLAVEDLSQDVWLIFYDRFQKWEFGTEMESSEARPVLSFLFRTCGFVARSHARLSKLRKSDPLGEREEGRAREGEGGILRGIEARRALSLARRVCPEEELDVLLAKLAGLTAREIAALLSVTEPVVDHRYRDALKRLRRELKLEGSRD